MDENKKNELSQDEVTEKTELYQELSQSPNKLESVQKEEDNELTEEEQKELYIQQLKDSKWRFFPKKHYGKAYKKKRKLKNKLTRKSRKANRK